MLMVVLDSPTEERNGIDREAKRNINWYKCVDLFSCTYSLYSYLIRYDDE